MADRNNTHIFAGCALITFLFVLTLFPRISNPYYIIGWALALLISFKTRHSILSLSFVDVSIILLWLYDFSSIFITSNWVLGFSRLAYTTISLLYYFIIRLYFNDKSSIDMLLKMYSIIISLFAIFVCVAFFIFEKSIHSVGFNNLYHFRSLLKPLGMPSNNVSNSLLGFMGIFILFLTYNIQQKKNIFTQILLLLPILFGLIVSFSRGIYISIALVLLIFFIWLVKTNLVERKYKTLTLLLTIVFFVTVGTFYMTEIVQTIKFHDTISQQKSTQSRIETTQKSLNVAKDNLLFGTGDGSWLLAMNGSRYESDKIAYTTVAPNIVSQILIEKGTLGLILWILIIISIGIIYIRRTRTDWIYGVIVVVIGSVFIREMTYPTLLSSLSIQLMLLTIIGIGENCRNTEERSIFFKKTQKNIILIAPLLFCLAMTIFSIIIEQDNKYNKKAIELISNKDYAGAITAIEKTRKRLPYLINRSSIYWEIYNQKKDQYYLDLAYENLKTAIINYPQFTQLQHDLAYIEFMKGNTDSSLNLLKDIVRKYPDSALYNYSLFNLCYKANKENVESVIPNIVQAIVLSPDIFQTSLWTNDIAADTMTKKIIEIALKKAVTTSESDPLILAKYGKILHCLGDVEAAEKSISTALAQMPNLPMAWFNLACIVSEKGDSENADLFFKRCFILSGIPKQMAKDNAKSKEVLLKDIFDTYKSNNNFFISKYLLKFTYIFNSQGYPFNIDIIN